MPSIRLLKETAYFVKPSSTTTSRFWYIKASKIREIEQKAAYLLLPAWWVVVDFSSKEEYIRLLLRRDYLKVCWNMAFLLEIGRYSIYLGSR